MTEQIIITVIIYLFGALSFWGFMDRFNKKNYFSAGSYLFSTIGTIVMLIRFIIEIKP